MYKYSVKIRKVSGRLNESHLPQKNLVIKSKSRISQKKAFMMVEKYLKNKYGLTLHEAEIINEGFFGNLFGKKKQAQAQQPQQSQQSQITISEFPTLVNYKGETRQTSVIFPEYMYDARTGYTINGPEEWTVGVVYRLLPKGLGAFITSLDSNFEKEFNVAKQWADNLSASLQKATPQNINNVLKQAISFANMTEYIQTVEEEVGNIFDRIDNIKNLNRGVHQQVLSNDNKKIVNAISMFLKGIESIAEQKNANKQIINTIYSMVQRIMRHYTIAKLMNSAVSRETDNGGTLLGQIYYALSK